MNEGVVSGEKISKATGVIGFIAMFGVAMSACGGSSMVKEPETLQTTKPVASNCDDDICANIDWVIVRNGPGSWAKNATWDEYLIRVANQTEQSVTVQRVTVIDSLSYPLTTENHRAKLARQSSATVRRYRNVDLTVKAGDGTGALLAAGGTATLVGVGIGAAAVGTYGAAEEYHLDLFFPYGPSPRGVEVAYTVSGQKRILRIDTESALDGLHFESEQVD